ncbi:MAG: hypothetical protein AUJ92_08690 [Armatimonadetes bacterium CG2_30_59_28]|nr:hypothetical protein [Armatimonadota bacterium]OIO95021.1 MAG: hypothetical protein AUJ92_08690 [Armatimonadetes bacterium CG2_30_59_28]PIX39300.1 MAG: hypothetical protein COZ56_17940 [Armatimonadetes bacterium CG_4_8_14_3_um_filter_58_9]PIY43388.1 MAG: hypothetical protein COZ05_11220 [Armatimonadetes bacterium CG_4_10_14_3_um_filter_59_10]
MDLDVFRQKVRATFGPGLENATAGTIHEFVRQIEAEGRGEPPPSGRYLLRESSPANIHQILRNYFLQVLDMPLDDAIVSLWLTAADMAFYDGPD